MPLACPPPAMVYADRVWVSQQVHPHLFSSSPVALNRRGFFHPTSFSVVVPPSRETLNRNGPVGSNLTNRSLVGSALRVARAMASRRSTKISASIVSTIFLLQRTARAASLSKIYFQSVTNITKNANVINGANRPVDALVRLHPLAAMIRFGKALAVESRQGTRYGVRAKFDIF